MTFKKITLSLAILMLSNTLFGATPQEIANILKAKAGTTLTNPVLFAKYGNGAFDWIVVTSDGKFVAKLDGMNPDGTFKYTILGDPVKYGLKLDVSLNGVHISKIKNSQTNNSTEIARKKALADEAISVAVSGVASDLSLSLSTNTFRSLDSEQNTPLPLALKVYNLVKNTKPHTTRATNTQQCNNGGSVTVSNSETSANYSFNNCKVSGYTLNGKLSINIAQTSFSVVYTNFSIKSSPKDIYISSATLNATLTSSREIKTLNFEAPYTKIDFKTQNLTYEFKNFRQNIRMIDADTYQVTTNMKFKASCQNNWLTLTTLSPLIAERFSICPTGGIMRVQSGSEDIKIFIYQDKSIDVKDTNNGSLIHHYNNCLEIENQDICSYR